MSEYPMSERMPETKRQQECQIKFQTECQAKTLPENMRDRMPERPDRMPEQFQYQQYQ